MLSITLSSDKHTRIILFASVINLLYIYKGKTTINFMIIKGSHTTKTDFTANFLKHIDNIDGINSVILGQIVNKRSSSRLSTNQVRVKLDPINDTQLKTTLSHNKLVQVIYINTINSIETKEKIINKPHKNFDYK